MRQATIKPDRTVGRRRVGQHGGVPPGVLAAVFFLLGLAVGAVLLHRPAVQTPVREAAIELSPATKGLLAHLDKPVSVHLYALLDSSTPASLRDFANRAAQLVAAYQQAAPEKVLIVAQTNGSPESALEDGLAGFDLDKGDGCYLGVAFSCGAKKETLAQISPQWETALEADISRAIQHVTETSSTAAVVRPAVPVEAGVAEDLQNKIPNLASISLEEGTRILREDAVKEFTTAVNEMQAQVQEAQARLAQAKASGSATDQDSAMKQLQATESTNAQRLKELAAKAQARVDALKKLKPIGK